MARFATGANAHMRVRHGDGATLIVHRMANGAITGGRLENSLDMAGLTAYAFMRTQKLESSRGMIKSGIGLGRRSGHAKHQDRAHQHQCNRTNPEAHRLEFNFIYHGGYLGMNCDMQIEFPHLSRVRAENCAAP
ncbi:MAG: hypothetical protein IPP88_11335 [Betaproteobacteria bacterium]|nr:hypothetical protein [Betaproteobacteria bacterium]